MTIVLNSGVVVEIIDLDDYDLDRPMAWQVLKMDIVDAVALGERMEAEEHAT